MALTPARVPNALVRSRRTFLKPTSAAHWLQGFGVIEHCATTVERIEELLDLLVEQGRLPSRANNYALLAAADRIASQGMWLVVHMTYAARVYTDGRELAAEEFKSRP